MAENHLPNVSDNFLTRLIVDDMNNAHFEMDLDDHKFELGDQTKDLVNSDETESQDKRMNWNNKATKLLLMLYKQKEPLLGSNKFKNKRIMWENISEKMTRAGFTFSAIQVENRFKTLLRAYRKVHQSENLSARSRKTCLYQEEMDTIFLKDVAKLGSVEIQFEQDESNLSIESEDTKQNDSLDISTDLDHNHQAFKKIDWDDRATSLLLTLYKQKKPLVDTKQFKSKKEMWESIASEISKLDYLFSGVQVENRFKTLLRAYKKVLTSGKRSKSCPYQEELDKIFLEDDNVFPEVIVGTERVCLKKEVSQRLGIPIDDIEDGELEGADDEDLFEEKKEISGDMDTEDVLEEIKNVLADSEKKSCKAAYRNNDSTKRNE